MANDITKQMQHITTIEAQNKVSKTLPGHTLMSLEHH
jgi:hypothetical protein